MLRTLYYSSIQSVLHTHGGHHTNLFHSGRTVSRRPAVFYVAALDPDRVADWRRTIDVLSPTLYTLFGPGSQAWNGVRRLFPSKPITVETRHQIPPLHFPFSSRACRYQASSSR